MDYSRNSNFIVKRKDNKLLVKKNKLNVDPEKYQIFKVDTNRKVDITPIPCENFFEEKREGVFVVRVYYKYNGKNHNKRYYVKIENNKLVLQRSNFPSDLSGKIKSLPNSEFGNEDIGIEADVYLKILDFYIIKSPSVRNGKTTTTKSFDIKQIWGNECWRKNGSLKPQLVNAIIEYNNTKFEDCVKKFNSENDSKHTVEKLNLHDKSYFDHRIKIGVVDVCNNIFMSIFIHLRNAFAHGRFYFYESANTKMLFLEDANKNNVTARMTIPVEQLIKWIDIITNTNSKTAIYK